MPFIYLLEMNMGEGGEESRRKNILVYQEIPQKITKYLWKKIPSQRAYKCV